jgi:hypothetical protein
MALILLLAFTTSGDTSPKVETRQYTVSADGRSVGTYSQIIKFDPDQNEYEVTTASDVHVHVKVLLVKVDHDYTFRGKETWAFGYLQNLQSEVVENGAKRPSSADKDNKYDWTSSYWRLPRKECMSREFNLLDLDTGSGRLVKISYVDKDANGDHYRLTGVGFRVELWYDERGRLARREMSRNGRWTIVQRVKE